MIIESLEYDNKKISLCSKSYERGKNVYTVLVGRNGCGKSTLFKRICLLSLYSLANKNSDSHHVDFLSRIKVTGAESTGHMTFHEGDRTHTISVSPPRPIFTFNGTGSPFKLEDPTWRFAPAQINLSTNNPSGDFDHPKLIAVSSSPFDKFPALDELVILRESNLFLPYYVYRGARAQRRSGSRQNFLESKIEQLASSIMSIFCSKERRSSEILPLFEYLGLSSRLKITLNACSFFDIKDYTGDNPKDIIQEIRSGRFFKDNPARDEEISAESVSEVINCINLIYSQFHNPNDDWNMRHRDYVLDLDLESDSEQPLLQAFTVLVNYDLVDLQNIELTRSKSNLSYPISLASSGELCILFNILSIAGAITDNSIILIDEPELSLHPAWQTDFLPLLEKIFSNYKECHFIIATHSPQITSSLSPRNSYIVNLENNPATLLNEPHASAQSSDYQLAYIFNAPGHKNEILLTQIIDLLSQIRDGRELDNNFIEETEKLLHFYNLVPANDPVKKLLSTLRKAVRVLKNA